MTVQPTMANLSNTERFVLNHSARYHMTTVFTLQRGWLGECSFDAVRKILSRLVEKGWLIRFPLQGQEAYFVLGAKALDLLGLRRSLKPLGRQAIIERYGVLLAASALKKEIITEEEFRQALPHLVRPGFSMKNYFIDSSLRPAGLGLFVVDHDKAAVRMPRKIGQRVGTIFANTSPQFREFLVNGLFSVHVITATPGKRDNLIAAFARKPLPNVRITVEVYPQLQSFFLINRR